MVGLFLISYLFLLCIPQDSGGTCVADPPEMGGIFGPNYNACVEDLMKEYITATALSSMLACFVMGGWANLPLILAPGMGMNAYFTYSVVGEYIVYKDHIMHVIFYLSLFIFLTVSPFLFLPCLSSTC
jgi:xanthine/uracil/vitamin C permease (AzgA family)